MKHHNSVGCTLGMAVVTWRMLALQDRVMMVCHCWAPCANQHDVVILEGIASEPHAMLGLKCEIKNGAQADVEASVYHNARLVSTGALDVMTTQRDLIYTARAETRVKIHLRDKAALGITIARLVEEGGPPTKASFLTRFAFAHCLEIPRAAVSDLHHFLPQQLPGVCGQVGDSLLNIKAEFFYVRNLPKTPHAVDQQIQDSQGCASARKRKGCLANPLKLVQVHSLLGYSGLLHSNQPQVAILHEQLLKYSNGRLGAEQGVVHM